MVHLHLTVPAGTQPLACHHARTDPHRTLIAFTGSVLHVCKPTPRPCYEWPRRSSYEPLNETPTRPAELDLPGLGLDLDLRPSRSRRTCTCLPRPVKRNPVKPGRDVHVHVFLVQSSGIQSSQVETYMYMSSSSSHVRSRRTCLPRRRQTQRHRPSPAWSPRWRRRTWPRGAGPRRVPQLGCPPPRCRRGRKRS